MGIPPRLFAPALGRDAPRDDGERGVRGEGGGLDRSPRWLRREGITTELANRRAGPIHERTWAALEQYRGPEAHDDWWDDLVRRVLGKPSAVRPEERGELKIIAE